MSYNLFLDDERKPAQVKWVDLPLVEWLIVKNFDEFTRTISSMGMPLRVSFDHDLADEHYQEYHKAIQAYSPHFGKFRYDEVDERTGYECAKWLVSYCMDRGLPFPEYYVHTLNCIGKENIVSYIESFKRSL